ncbi:histidine phosphatase family protein [Rhodanobacter koreensis]
MAQLRDTPAMKRLLLTLCCLLLITPARSADIQAPAARTIVLVRHGYYVPDPALGDQPGPHLASIGVAQAQLVGARLAGLPTRFDAMYVSPVQRARDTAAIIAADFPGRHFEVINDLAECTPPTRRADIMAQEKPKDLATCTAQLDRVFTRYFKPATGHERTELFVCHGNVIRYLVMRALGVDTKAWLEMSVGNASITEIRIEANGSFKVISVGDVGHLPPSMLTGATGDREHNLAIPPLPVQ